MDKRVLVASATKVDATEEIAPGWPFTGKLEPITGPIGSRDVAVFHGGVDAGKLGLICFVPFGLYTRGTVNSERSSSPAGHAGPDSRQRIADEWQMGNGRT